MTLASRVYINTSQWNCS